MSGIAVVRLLFGAWLFACWAFVTWRLAQELEPDAPPRVRALHTCVLGLALVVVPLFGLVMLGALGLPWPVVLFSVAAFALRRRSPSPTAAEHAIPAPLPFVAWLALAAAAAVVLRQWALGWTAPPDSWDALTYHLFYPATWLQDGRISYVDTYFGDVAPTYFPCNVELWFLWLMLPFHDHYLAGLGQVPFVALAVISAWTLLAELGVRPGLRWPAIACLVATEPLARQSRGADVDVAVVALALAVAALGLRYRHAPSCRRALVLGLASGLLLGAKLTAPVLLVLLLLPVLRHAASQRRGADLLWLGLALFICGGGWYLRNLWATGNPVYPVALSLGGFSLFDGAFDTAAMRNSPFAVARWNLGSWAAHGVAACGGALVLPCLYGLVLGLGGRVQPHIRSTVRWLVAAAVAFAVFCWWVLPYNSEYRLFLPSVALAFVALAAAAEQRGVAGRLAWWLAVGGVFVVCVWEQGEVALAPGRSAYLHAGLGERPWRAAAWLALCAVAMRAALVCRARGRLAQPRYALAGAAGVAALALLLSGTIPMRALFRVAPFVTPAYEGFFAPAQWLDDQACDSITVAYAGMNGPYPFMGRGQRHRVRCIAVNDRRDWRYHDYVAAARREGPWVNPDSPKAAFQRADPSPEAWLANLEAEGVDYVAVYALHPVDRPFYRTDDAGFPLERGWAEARPDRFRTVLEDPRFVLYARARDRDPP